MDLESVHYTLQTRCVYSVIRVYLPSTDADYVMCCILSKQGVQHLLLCLYCQHFIYIYIYMYIWEWWGMQWESVCIKRGLIHIFASQVCLPASLWIPSNHGDRVSRRTECRGLHPQPPEWSCGQWAARVVPAACLQSAASQREEGRWVFSSFFTPLMERPSKGMKCTSIVTLLRQTSRRPVVPLGLVWTWFEGRFGFQHL